MGKNKASAHHTSTYFHTRRVSISLSCFRSPTLAGAPGNLGLLQGYWQCLLAMEAQEIFTIATPGGLYTPTRAPQGILNATSYFQATLTRVPEGLNCMIWVDDVFYWGLDDTDFFNTLELILERLTAFSSSCFLGGASGGLQASH